MRMIESNTGLYYYHLTEDDEIKNGAEALCGDKRTMLTHAHVSTWGVRTHVGETYCQKCNESLDKQNQEGIIECKAIQNKGTVWQRLKRLTKREP